jgi:tRNA pseudouridine55 synthase
MIHGWIVIDKPLGRSSMQTTSRVKRLLSTRKAGHAGTLDPLASGILPIALGEATKTIPFMVDAAKTYEFTIQWGQQTNTDDQEGEILKVSEVRPSQEQIQKVLPDFIGKISQVPPAFSAVKINGKRAYAMARGGKEVVLEPREITVHNLELLGMSDQDHATFKCHCGKGTYIRSLARDIALKLGTYGHVSYLRRTAVGAFDEKNAISLDFLENMSHKGHVEESIFPLDWVLDDIPDLVLTAEEEGRFCHGQRLLKEGLVEDETFVCRNSNGGLLGLAKAVEGLLKPVRMLNIHERKD